MESSIGTNETSGARIISGTDWNNVKFLDQQKFEEDQFTDTSHDHEFLVRGKNYMKDKKKIATGHAMFKMIFSEMISVAEGARYDHISQMGRVKKRLDALATLDNPPEVLVLNFQYPNKKSHLTIFAAPKSVNSISDDDEEDTRKFKELWARWKCGVTVHSPEYSATQDTEHRLKLFEEEKAAGLNVWRWGIDTCWADKEVPGVFPYSNFKNKCFKVIPLIKEGHWSVKAAMAAALPPQMPCLLGRHLQTKYFRGICGSSDFCQYTEIDVDIGSSIIASNVIGVMRSFHRSVVLEYAVVLQGENEEELPERIMTSSLCNYMDTDHTYAIDDEIKVLTS